MSDDSLSDYTPPTRPAIADCITRRVYVLHSRNLGVGVYDGEQGFIGIREKFGHLFLFTEYHWDQGAPYGTVDGAVDSGIDVPEPIQVVETLGRIDKLTGRPIEWATTIPNPNPSQAGKGKLGWWRYVDGEPAPAVGKLDFDADGRDTGLYAQSVPNDALFAFLDECEAKLTPTHPYRSKRKWTP
jgi:hypothetical protein